MAGLLTSPRSLTCCCAAATLFAITALSHTGSTGARRGLEEAYAARRPFAARLPAAAFAPFARDRTPLSTLNKPWALRDAEALLARYPNAALQGRADLLNLNVEAAIRWLTAAEAALPRDPGIAAELGAAYAVRGEMTGRPLDWARAVELSSRALELDPGLMPALHNRALGWMRLRNYPRAARDWEQITEQDPDPGWREEARVARMDALARMRRGERNLEPALPEQRLNAWIGAGLPDPPPAGLGAELAGKHGDQFWSDLMVQPRSGWKALAAAVDANRQLRFADALEHANLARREAGAGRAAGLRAQAERLYALQQLRQSQPCIAEAARLADQAARLHYVWIEWHARLEGAMCRSIAGDVERGLGALRAGMAGVRASGYRDLALRWSAALLSDGIEVGDWNAVWNGAPPELDEFWQGPFEARRGQQLLAPLERGARAYGLPRVAFLLRSSSAELIAEAAAGSKRPARQAVSQANLAVAAAETGQLGLAEESIRGALVAARSEALSADDALRVEAARATVDLALGRDPGAVWRRVQEVKAAPESPFMIARWRHLRGELRARTGDWAGARTDLAKAVEAYGGNQSDGQRAWSWWMEARLEDKPLDPAKAFADWERAAEVNPGTLLRGRTFVAFALLPRGVYAWVHDGKRVRGKRLPLSAEDAVIHARRFARLCASRDTGLEAIEHERRWLWRRLIEPLAGWIRPDSELLIESGGELGLIPWRVLLGRRDARVAQVESLADAARRERPLRMGAESHAVIAADPRLDATQESMFQPLPQARSEAEWLRTRFPRSQLLVGPEVTRLGLRRAGPEADLFHFGGHGVVLGAEGALLLAPGQTWGGAALESADWRRCQLAVVAACSTAFGEQEGQANPGTVARHLLRGGAARVLAARWAIDSEVTEGLLKSFYTKVLEGQSASAALAGALGELPDPAHPFFWGAFELFGQP